MDVFNASVPTVNAKDLTVNAAYNLNRLVKVPSKFGRPSPPISSTSNTSDNSTYRLTSPTG